MNILRNFLARVLSELVRIFVILYCLGFDVLFLFLEHFFNPHFGNLRAVVPFPHIQNSPDRNEKKKQGKPCRIKNIFSGFEFKVLRCRRNFRNSFSKFFVDALTYSIRYHSYLFLNFALRCLDALFQLVQLQVCVALQVAVNALGVFLQQLCVVFQVLLSFLVLLFQ